MRPNHADRSFTRRQWLSRTTVAGAICVSGCRNKTKRSAERSLFRVAGTSMNPTLWDESVLVRCRRCDIATRVDAEVVRQSLSKENRVCWHCGFQDETAPEILGRRPPDLMEVMTDPNAPVIPGDLVVLASFSSTRSSDFHDHVHVKRVLAIGGQSVSVDPRGRLLIDHQLPAWDGTQTADPSAITTTNPLRLPSASVLVNDTRSDCFPSGSPNDYPIRDDVLMHCRWRVDDEGYWTYTHHSVYRGNRPMKIMDDYPCNWHVERTLNPVDQIVVTVDLNSTTHPWRKIRVKSQGWQLSDRDLAAQTLAIEPNQPTVRFNLNRVQHSEESAVIAFRFEGADRPTTSNKTEAPNLSRVRIERPLVYRVADRLPDLSTITLQDDEIFVVGDNVPLSLDSRQRGPVLRSALLGTVADLRLASISH